jgi:hypothetical protein
MTIYEDLNRATEKVYFERNMLRENKLIEIERILLEINGSAIGYVIGRLENLIVDHRGLVLDVLGGTIYEYRMYGNLSVSEFATIFRCSRLLMEDTLHKILFARGLLGLAYIAEKASLEIRSVRYRNAVIENDRVRQIQRRDRAPSPEPID